MDGRPIRETLSRYVKRVMKQKGFTLRDVELRSGGKITDGYVSSIINGIATNPSVEKIKALAVGLGVDMNDVFHVASGEADREPQDNQNLDPDQFMIVLELLAKIVMNAELLEILQELVSLTPEERRVVLKTLRSLNEPVYKPERAREAS
jgi:transcriptional regulator with XRE-family HTH domain